MKKMGFYLSFLFLPVLSIILDLVNRELHRNTSEIFNLFPTLLFEILANTLFTILIIWMTLHISKYPLRKPWALALLVVGLLLISLPIFSYTGIVTAVSLQFSIVYWSFSGIAGIYIFLVGLVKIFSLTQTKTV